MNRHALELSSGDRFAFGRNWASFLQVLDAGRIGLAEDSLRRSLEVDNLHGRSFLDIGSGSGLFSLAARNLGARVHSFDFDPDSVGCTCELRRRFHPDDAQWVVEEGSALDTTYLSRLGRFDVVYSWGVLHHTGAMWTALANVADCVAPDGQLLIAIYNDQGDWSRRWLALKRAYNKLPAPLQPAYAVLTMGSRELKRALVAAIKGRFGTYVQRIREYEKAGARGMNYWHDMKDWIGGYPFEVAKPEQIFAFYRLRSFELTQLTTHAGGFGCNQFVFSRRESAAPGSSASAGPGTDPV